QAEDGIRDLIVTGVQTCALPISQLQRDEPGGSPHQPIPFTSLNGADQPTPGGRSWPTGCCGPPTTRPTSRRRWAAPCRATSATRSEERRVGKEWRAGRAP